MEAPSSNLEIMSLPLPEVFKNKLGGWHTPLPEKTDKEPNSPIFISHLGGKVEEALQKLGEALSKFSQLTPIDPQTNLDNYRGAFQTCLSGLYKVHVLLGNLIEQTRTGVQDKTVRKTFISSSSYGVSKSGSGTYYISIDSREENTTLYLKDPDKYNEVTNFLHKQVFKIQLFIACRLETMFPKLPNMEHDFYENNGDRFYRENELEVKEAVYSFQFASPDEFKSVKFNEVLSSLDGLADRHFKQLEEEEAKKTAAEQPILYRKHKEPSLIKPTFMLIATLTILIASGYFVFKR